MRTAPLVSLLAVSAVISAAAAVEPDAVAVLAGKVQAADRFAGRTAAFTVADETFTIGGKPQTFAVIRDQGKLVGIVHPGMHQLDMATFRPDRTATDPAFGPYYSWGTLLGTRITTAAWYGGMSASGTVASTWTVGGRTLTLTTTQTWAGPSPLGSSRYVMTLSLDPRRGYVWDIATDLSVRGPLRGKDGTLEDPEFLNWQVKTYEMGQFEGRRLPLAWHCDRTIFLNKDDKLVGFFLNPPGIDRSRFKRSEVREGGFVASLPDADGWGIALVHAEKAPFSRNNATCNMWSDSHNLLRLPKEPAADGTFAVRARWRFLALVPEEVADVIARTEMDDLGRSQYPSRLPH